MPDASTASDASQARGVGDTGAGGGRGGWAGLNVHKLLLPGAEPNQRERSELLGKVFLVSDVLTSLLTATVMDRGQKRGRCVGKGNVLN